MRVSLFKQVCVICVIYCAMLYGLRVCVCLCLLVFVLFLMCQYGVFVIYCVLLYGVFLCLCAWALGVNVFVCSFVSECVLVYVVFCSWCLCVRYVFACVACGVLCDVVWIVFCVFACVGVLLSCLCDVSMLNYALPYGLCSCCRVLVRVGFNVFVRVVCNLLCDVVGCAFRVFVFVCVLVFVDCAWMPCL